MDQTHLQIFALVALTAFGFSQQLSSDHFSSRNIVGKGTTGTASNVTIKIAHRNQIVTDAPRKLETTTQWTTTTPESISSTPDWSTTTTETVEEMITTAAPSEEECPKLRPNMDGLTQDQFMNKLTDPCRFDKVIKPRTNKSLPVHVHIDLMNMEGADQLKFKAHMMVHLHFVDWRLKYADLSPTRSRIHGDHTLKNKIYIPYVVQLNDRSATASPAESDLLVDIYPEGRVEYSYKLSTTFACWMNLKKFPFDKQQCDFTIYSWSYNASELSLLWDRASPISISDKLHLVEFSLASTETTERTVPSSFRKGSFVGNSSGLTVKFKLTREVGFYVMDFFLPSILLVCTSWVTFWLQADASAPRVTLGTSTMLAFITLNGNVAKNIPKVSYIKASEIWFLACACFIFGSMAEFAFVNVIWRRKKRVELKSQSASSILKGAITPSLARKQLRKKSDNSMHKTTSASSLDDMDDNLHRNMSYLSVTTFPSTLKVPSITMQSQDELINSDHRTSANNVQDNSMQSRIISTWHTMTPHEVANWIDRKARIVFPVSFLIFNMFYWTFVYIL